MMRKWWGNPPLVTPSSKYVGDQALACAEKYISEYGEDKFVKLMKRGIDNIEPDEFFGGGEYLLATTKGFFTGVLGKHPNPGGVDPRFKMIVDEALNDSKVFTEPVGYYQDVHTGQFLADNLRKLGAFSPDTVNVFMESLNRDLTNPITNLDGLATRINRPSEEKMTEEQRGEEKISAVQILNALNFVYDKDAEVAAGQKDVRDKVGAALNGISLDVYGLQLAIRDFIFRSSLEPGYAPYRDGIRKYGPLISRLPTEVFSSGLSAGESVLLTDNDADIHVKLLEISEPYDHFKRRLKFQIDSSIIFREVIDAKLQKSFAKGFKKARQEAYGGERKRDHDMPCPIRGVVMAQIHDKEGNLIGPGSIVKGGEVVMCISANKIANEIRIPDNVKKAQIVSMPAEEWDVMGAGKCLLTYRVLDEEENTTPSFPFFSESVDTGSEEIVAPEKAVGVKLSSFDRLAKYEKDAVMGYWIMEDGSEQPIYAPYKCQTDIIYGNKTLSSQRIEPQMVAFTIKDV